MKQGKIVFAAVAVCTALVCGACGGGAKYDREAPALSSPDATLTLSPPAEGTAISGDLFGVFLEDINYASQALDDNMVENGSFQSDAGLSLQNKSFSATYGWTAGGGAKLSSVTADSPLGDLYSYGTNTVAEHALVETEAGGTLSNSGYVPVPMAVEKGTGYKFSAFLKTSADLTLTAEITDGETVYASLSIPVSGGWKKYERTVQASGTADEGLSLKLTFSAAATVQLDGVSFETSDSTVGIKNYLYEAVKELSPAFVRFPGGCVTEGENISQTYDWKNSVGAVQTGRNAGDDGVPAFTYTFDDGNGEREVTTYGEAITRTPNVNLWQNNGSEYYPMDYGIGFYEYFTLCESLGAKALPVVSCGLSCQGQAFPGAPLAGRHNKGVEDYIRDAADLIEFAKGDENTTWGKIRADMGHPKPFEMDYLGVGNEQWDGGTASSDYFTGYYEKFLENEYFTEKCEEYGITLIVGNHQQLVHCEGSIDFTSDTPRTTGIAKDAALAYRTKGKIESLGDYGVQDHHYYNSPVDFLLHTHMYDGYTREGADRYEVFVGEYSANNAYAEAGNFASLYKINGWLSALSEAAMMTGFERNGDIVKLAAYAPMFAPVRENYRHWAVDMMLFTNTQLVRTANYYVQQLFMQNAGTKVLPVSAEYAEDFEPACEYAAGGVKRNVEKLSYVASVDEETGDVIVKVVNAGEDTVGINFKTEGIKAAGTADLIELYEELDAVNTLGDEIVAPRTHVLGKIGSTVGCRVRAHSVTVLRIHTK